MSARNLALKRDQVTENTALHNFQVDIESWLYAIKQSKARFDSETVHALIRQMSGSFEEAVKGEVDFDLVQLAEELFVVTGKVVPLKEVLFYVLAHLPNPALLNELQFQTFESIVLKAKERFPEVVSRFEARINSTRNR